MEHNLDLLIDKIKTQGIKKAEESAQSIIEAAEQKAAQIIENANSTAHKTIENAKQEEATLIARGQDALKQAQRDLILSLESKLKDLFNKYVASCTHEALSSNKLAEIISVALSSVNANSGANLFVHISKNDADTITKGAISGSIKSNANVEIKVDPNINKGFRISQAGNDYAFDFTSEAISEGLSVFLTPNIQELLR